MNQIPKFEINEIIGNFDIDVRETTLSSAMVKTSEENLDWRILTVIA